jgi:thiol-disulfide isomerase/thioredoxin
LEAAACRADDGHVRRALLTLALLATVACGRAGADRAAGDSSAQAPAFSVTAFTPGGGTIELGALRANGPVVVNFFESWCSTCNHEQPDLNAVARQYAGRVAFVGISNRDTVPDGLQYAAKHAVPYPLAHAPDVWRAYAVPYQPTTVVVGRDGRELKRWSGAVTAEQLTKALESALTA